MREILFRGKTDKGEWIEGVYYKQTSFYGDDFEAHYIISSKDELEDNMMTFERVIPETIGQYTGLADNNSTKIFEGDIVKAYYRTIKKQDYAIGQVIFENGTFKIEVRGSKKDREFEKYTDADVRAYAIENNFLNRGFVLEVTGNIHDNPELLKGGVQE